MNVLVTGGAGFVGWHLIAALAASGETGIRVLSRSPDRVFAAAPRSLAVAIEALERLVEAGSLEPDALTAARERATGGEALLRDAIQVVPADIRDTHALTDALDGIDAVVHTVGIIRETEGRSFADTNTGATQALIAAMQERGVNRLVSMGILGASDDPRLPYGRSRWRAEQAIMSSGLAWTLIKPSLVLGVADAVSIRFIRTLDMTPPVVPLPDGGRARFQPMYVGDLTAVLLACLRDPNRAGHAYEIGGSNYVTFRELVQTFARVLGKRRLLIPVPTVLIRPGALLLTRFLKNPPVTPAELGQLGVDNVTALDAVQRAFGFEPRALNDYLGFVREVAALSR